MADNVQITAGTGTTVRTDDVGSGVQIQVVKLALGADGAEDLLVDSGQKTMANSVPVTIASDQTFSMSEYIYSISVTPTVTVGAYHANDDVGGLFTLTNAMRTSGGSGFWQSIHIIDKANQKAAFVIVLFNSSPGAATISNNVAISFSTDVTKVIRTFLVPSTAYDTVGGVAFADMNIGQVVTASGSANLYAAVMCYGTPTYSSASDLTFTFGFVQE